MAATRLIALHINKGKTVAQCLADRTDYSENAAKTEDGKYISAYACDATPEEANKVGYETAMRFTKGKHAFIVATHIDRAHIHNHIIFNSKKIVQNLEELSIDFVRFLSRI